MKTTIQVEASTLELLNRVKGKYALKSIDKVIIQLVNDDLDLGEIEMGVREFADRMTEEALYKLQDELWENETYLKIEVMERELKALIESKKPVMETIVDPEVDTEI